MKILFCVSFFLLLTTTALSQWTQTSGPSGGGISDFAFVDGKILAASFDLGNGVFASTDNGVSWRESGLQGIMLSKIAVNGNTVIAASTTNSYNETDTIYRSGDGGGTWQKVMTVSNINSITSICHHEQKWFLAAEGQAGGMIVSSDDGMNWTQFKPALFNFSHPVTLLSFGKYLIAGTEYGGTPEILRSQNDGQTCVQFTQLAGKPLTQIHCGIISGNTIWLGVIGGVIFSTDSGNSWTSPSNKGLEHKVDEYLTSIAVTGNHLLAITSLNNFYYSWDGGNQWKKYSGNGLPANASYFFTVAVRNDTFFLGSSSGIMRSGDNGQQWQYSTQGLRSAAISQLGSYQAAIFAATERGVSFSTDQGTFWHDPQNLNDLDDVRISAFMNGKNSFYAYGSGLFSWSGSSWNAIDTTLITGFTEGASGKLFAARQSSDPIEGTGGIYVSNNGGNDWQEVLTFKNTIDTEYYFLPHCLVSHDANLIAIQRVFAFQTFTSKYFMYRSNDNGLSWHASEIANPPSLIYYADNEFYMGTYGGGLLHSTDDGLSWIQDKSLRSDCDVISFLKAGNTLLLSGSGTTAPGLYWSNDDGGSWQFGNSNTSITGPLTYDGTYIYSGGPSVWKRSIRELDVNDWQKISSENKLQVYPNPTADNIHVNFNSTGSRIGTLIISDEKGSIVYEQNSVAEGSTQSISIDAIGLSDGVYYAKILDRSGYSIANNRFVVVKK